MKRLELARCVGRCASVTVSHRTLSGDGRINIEIVGADLGQPDVSMHLNFDDARALKSALLAVLPD